jgi:hypothetical protein
MHSLHKIQSDKRSLKLEGLNFSEEKALTQWWYYDFFFEDGSVLVLLFAPYHWWNDHETKPDPKSLFYVSYMKPDGELISAKRVFDSKEVIYEENSLKCSYLEIVKSHEKKSREYIINFFMDEIRGTAKITSTSKAFSPLPRGSLGIFGSKHYLKQKGKKTRYRYAAHVPQGDVSLDLEIRDENLNLSGKAYNEQGWFTGKAEQMCEGWVWFHFVSENINLFGANSFFYLEMKGEILVGGLNTSKSRCHLSDTLFDNNSLNFVLGGKLNFNSKPSFDISPIGKINTPLIYIPSPHSDQLWGTVLQQSRIRIYHKGEELMEEGRLLIETSRMSKSPDPLRETQSPIFQKFNTPIAPENPDPKTQDFVPGRKD